jgi:hypothetical protein
MHLDLKAPINSKGRLIGRLREPLFFAIPPPCGIAFSRRDFSHRIALPAGESRHSCRHTQLFIGIHLLALGKL